MNRKLVFESNTTNKFWNVSVKGSVMTVVFGRVGATGQTKAKTFASPAAAKAASEKLAEQKLKKGYVDGKGQKTAAKKSAPDKNKDRTSSVGPALPSEQPGPGLRFKGHHINFSGKLRFLRKKELVKVLEKEGAKIDDKLCAKTTICVFATAGSANQKRAQKLQDAGQSVEIIDEDTFRSAYLLPTPTQALDMLAAKKDQKRLAALLALNRDEYSRSTDEFSEVSVTKAKLGGAKLSGAQLCGVLLDSCDLRKADFSKALVTGWTGCDVREAQAAESTLWEMTDCDLRKAVLTKAEFRDLTRCRFESADLRNTKWDEVSGCRFDSAKMDKASMAYFDASECSFAKTSLKEAEFEDVTFESCDFRDANFQKAQFNGDSNVFEDCDFRNADFRGASLMSARFVRCKMEGARFENANCDNLEFDDSDISKTIKLDWAPTSPDKAIAALAAAAPTLKNVKIKANLKLGRKKLECLLYQFDHGNNSSRRQAWLNGDSLGPLSLWDAMTRIAKLHPNVKLDEKSLDVKQTKGKKAPALKPAAFKKVVLEAWREVLP